uniref:Uncharacterized protein n=1 Tax=Megaselia scalaris TaxID=36166 RepID=T1GRE3_MEGSC
MDTAIIIMIIRSELFNSVFIENLRIDDICCDLESFLMHLLRQWFHSPIDIKYLYLHQFDHCVQFKSSSGFHDPSSHPYSQLKM